MGVEPAAGRVGRGLRGRAWRLMRAPAAPVIPLCCKSAFGRKAPFYFTPHGRSQPQHLLPQVAVPFICPRLHAQPLSTYIAIIAVAPFRLQRNVLTSRLRPLMSCKGLANMRCRIANERHESICYSALARCFPSAADLRFASDSLATPGFASTSRRTLPPLLHVCRPSGEWGEFRCCFARRRLQLRRLRSGDGRRAQALVQQLPAVPRLRGVSFTTAGVRGLTGFGRCAGPGAARGSRRQVLRATGQLGPMGPGVFDGWPRAGQSKKQQFGQSRSGRFCLRCPAIPPTPTSL